MIKEYNGNAGRSRDPMRAVQTKKFLYLSITWSNGERIFATATNGTVTCKRMIESRQDGRENGRPTGTLPPPCARGTLSSG